MQVPPQAPHQRAKPAAKLAIGGAHGQPPWPFFPLLTANAIAGGRSGLSSRRPTATAPPDLN